MSTLDAERQEKARDYARASRRLWLINAVLSAAYVIAWLIFGWSLLLRAWLVSTWPLRGTPGSLSLPSRLSSEESTR